MITWAYNQSNDIVSKVVVSGEEETLGSLVSYVNSSVAEVVSASASRNYYVKSQKKAFIAFCLKTKAAISSATNIMTDLLTPLGSIRELSANIGYSTDGLLFKLNILKTGELQIVPMGTSLPSGTVIYGQVSVGL